MGLDDPPPGSLLFVDATVDPGALWPLIVDEAAVRLAMTGEGLLASRSDAAPAPTRRIGAPPGSVRPEVWAASWINRFARAVAAPGRSPGEQPPQTGVLIVKPGFIAGEETLGHLSERLGEVGYRIAERRLVDPADIRAKHLIRRHYAGHWALAETGGLSAAEQYRLLHIYRTASFAAATGHDAAECAVAPAHAFAREHGIAVETIAAWSREAADAYGLNSGSIHGSNEIGDLAAVTMLHRTAFYDGPPVFLINPHILTVALWYEAATRPVPVLRIEAAHDRALPWDRLRAEVCGTSDPASAWPGSLRRDVREGIVPLGVEAGVPISRLRNAVHLSNGPIEGLRETCIWFERRAEEVPMARTLAAASGWTLDQLLDVTHCSVEGRERVLVEATGGCSVGEAAALLRASPPARKRPSNLHTFRRLALAQTAADRLRDEPGVQTILVSGSVARGRCSADSDVDLIVLCDRTAFRIERTVEDGVTVETAFHATDELLGEIAAMTGSMQDLKRASRLSMALALYDPHDRHPVLQRAAGAVHPDEGERRELLASAQTALADMRAEGGDAAQARALCDVGCYLLLSSSAIRYQKPKWVIDDLRALDEQAAIDLLVHHYRLSDDLRAVADVIGTCADVIVRTAAALGLPSFAEARRAGLLEAAPEYSFLCQCLDDARSLWDDRLGLDADYAAKFAGKMAVCLLQDADEAARALPDIARDYDALFAAGGPVALTEDEVDRLERLIARGDVGPSD